MAELPDPHQYVPIGDYRRVVAEADTLRQGVVRMASVMKEWAARLCAGNANLTAIEIELCSQMGINTEDFTNALGASKAIPEQDKKC
ncbi:hypothetical protein [Mesorhizobium sp. M0898]|uniref:hypothetical protein n=1 Tax=Mesorhizobium sp. M0898 TaxID=2957020 RepID=UPI003337D0BF